MEAPPRENLCRAVFPGVELRSADGEAGPTMVGHFAKFNEWTEINSVFEGNFMERFAPGAFKKTFSESTPKVLFQHGRDHLIGDKPLGSVETLEEDDQGARYIVPLLDAPYVRDNILPGLERGLYGASFRFQVMQEEVNAEPERSDVNPDGIQERTVKEAKVMEFGPVTFPAYEGATAGVRSMTDGLRVIDRLAELLSFDQLVGNPERLRKLAEFLAVPERADGVERAVELVDEPNRDEALPEQAAGSQTHSSRGSRALYGNRKQEKPKWRL